jgi:hypothetical protein
VLRSYSVLRKRILSERSHTATAECRHVNAARIAYRSTSEPRIYSQHVRNRNPFGIYLFLCVHIVGLCVHDYASTKKQPWRSGWRHTWRRAQVSAPARVERCIHCLNTHTSRVMYVKFSCFLCAGFLCFSFLCRPRRQFLFLCSKVALAAHIYQSSWTKSGARPDHRRSLCKLRSLIKFDFFKLWVLCCGPTQSCASVSWASVSTLPQPNAVT